MPTPEKQTTYKNSGRKIYIRTFGCQMNDRDSEFIGGIFIEKGYKLVGSLEEADIVLFNTCSVREHAEERAISNMGQLMRGEVQGARCKDPKKVYGMVGCMAQRLGERLFDRLPRLDIVCGTGEIARLPELVEHIQETSYEGRGTKDEGRKKEKIIAIRNIDGHIPEVSPSYRESQKHAYVSIMHGCNNFCSYCVVPYVRGRERSRKTEDIINEVKNLAKKGISDITLLGQNVNSYKGKVQGSRFKVPNGECDFVELLKIINGIEGIKRVSFLTSHPKDASSELFYAMRDSDKVVKHLHLPMQSGSDKILKLMNRGYTAEKYLEVVNEGREIIPNLRLTTDIIVGFPDETEKDFNDTLKLMKKIKFDLAYIFKYSPRPGTAAAKMEDNVKDLEKKRRHSTLLELQKDMHNRKKHMQKIAALILAAFLLFTESLYARQIVRADTMKDLNIMFLKEDYAGLVKNGEDYLERQKIAKKDQKEALYLMGLSYIKLGRFNEARSAFNKILEISGDELREDAYIGIADSYFVEKKYSFAIENYKKIIAMYPRGKRLDSVNYHLGKAYEATGVSNFESKKKGNNIKTAKTQKYYVVQLGVFRDPENAESLARKLTRKKFESHIQKISENGEVLYKVKGGKFSNEMNAKRLVRKLKKKGFTAKIIEE